jgi:hypothetical protein
MFFSTSGNKESRLQTSSGVMPENIEDIKARLYSIEDEEFWQQSHRKLIISYNRSSMLFWALCFASLAFSTLNAYHGYTTSGAFSTGLVAVVIGCLYFVIELTVPISAHLMSWGSKGESRYAVRLLGLFAYTLGVIFSLLILQGKFASGADTATAQSEGRAVVFSSDVNGVKDAQETVKSLSGRLSGRSSDSILAEMNSILAIRTAKKETIAEATTNCTGDRNLSKERELCAKYDGLVRLHADAKTSEEAKQTIAKLSVNLLDTTRTSTKSSNVEDKVISALSGVPLENIQMFKSSIIAIMAALLTHLLWAAHGLTVNLSISRKRDQLFTKNRLTRAVANADNMQAKFIADTQANFLLARGTPEKIAAAVSIAPLREQPVATQIQTYLNNCALLGDEYSMQAGTFHDHYCQWARNEGIVPISIDRFVATIKNLQFDVSSEGRVIGAAIKG